MPAPSTGPAGAAEGGGAIRCAIAVVPLRAWEEFVAKVREIAGVIGENVVRHADDLRRRAAHCTFADCNFPDAAYAFLQALYGRVGGEVEHRGWFAFPERSDFSSGVLLAAEPPPG